MPITVETVVSAPIEKVWKYWTGPEHIVGWYFASDDWEAPAAECDLRVGGTFKTVMSAKDKSSGFDFVGTFTEVQEHSRIAYDIMGGRHVDIQFAQVDGGVKVTESFDPETENTEEMQRSGWQSILDNFKKHVESH